MTRQTPEQEEVSGWVLAREFARTSLKTTQNAAKRQSRRWIASWCLAVLLTTVALAYASAPVVAYITPVLVLFIAPMAALHRKSRLRR